jgi:hypothetical protein
LVVVALLAQELVAPRQVPAVLAVVAMVVMVEQVQQVVVAVQAELVQRQHHFWLPVVAVVAEARALEEQAVELMA